MFRALFAGLLLLMGGSAHAGTVMEIREQEDSVSWTEMSGQQARMSGVGDAYVLMDAASGQFVAVFPNARQIMDMSIDLPAQTENSNEPSPHRLEFNRLGKAEPIAGYPTERYSVVANHRLCAELWLSREALEYSGIRPFLRAFRRFYAQQRALFESRGLQYEACDDARQAAMERYEELGLPMRTRDANGNTLQEVLSIGTNVKLEEERFRIPDGYERINMEDLR
ncbi:MAG: DUF4412 domain-containing protein [Aquisalimonadaceae bacterium]